MSRQCDFSMVLTTRQLVEESTERVTSADQRDEYTNRGAGRNQSYHLDQVGNFTYTEAWRLCVRNGLGCDSLQLFFPEHVTRDFNPIAKSLLIEYVTDVVLYGPSANLQFGCYF